MKKQKVVFAIFWAIPLLVAAQLNVAIERLSIGKTIRANIYDSEALASGMESGNTAEAAWKTESHKKKVWVDTDLAAGMKRYNRKGYSDVDDGYALLQLFKADNIAISGISAVFGNTRIDDAFRLCNKMVREFSDDSIPVYKGAGKRIDLADVKTNEAVEAMAKALRREQHTLLAIGPATNVGLLLLIYPELAPQIKEVVLVAGRRSPTSYFEIGNPVRHAPDLNFDLDNDAFRILFQSGIKIVLCPFEVSNKVWLTQKDLDTIKKGSPGNEWLANVSGPWLQQWVALGDNGFNPFDVLASHYITAPQDLVTEPLVARLEIHVDDMQLQEKDPNFKEYLICDKKKGFPVLYCYDVVPEYHQRLLESLLKPN